MKAPRLTLNLLALATLALAGVTSADENTKEGYLLDSSGKVAKSAYGLCWRTASWTPAMAIAECDPDLVRVAEVQPETVAPTPVPAPAAPPASIAITLQSDTLFEFDSAVIRAEGRKDLDADVVGEMKKYPQIETVLVTGHADRIGSAQYNQRLSQRRADAVKAYLVQQGVEGGRIQTMAKGSSDPLVSCTEIKGTISGQNKELVECLKPNRRVVVELKTQKPAQR